MTGFKMKVTPEIENLTEVCKEHSSLDRSLYQKYDVKRGLRDINGKGVLAGLTQISNVCATKVVDGKEVPCAGSLSYRGYDIKELTRGFIEDDRYGFEETTYLLLFGKLPNGEELEDFTKLLANQRSLPTNFVRDVIMKAPSKDIMNALSRSVLTLYCYDKEPDDISLPNVLRQCLNLISVFPLLSVYGYQAYNHYVCGKSLYIHNPKKELSTAENILRMLRPDKKYSHLEAKILDLALILHMEHGGANVKVFYMFEDIKKHIKDWKDDEEIADYLEKILEKQTFDRMGLIYGMGHAVYTISDPRQIILKGAVQKLAKAEGYDEDFELYERVERLAPQVIGKKRKIYKGVASNVDFYSGLLYSMLDIPCELYTPMFATARIAGWSAHRLEEIVNGGKIIRPAYMSISTTKNYTPLDKR